MYISQRVKGVITRNLCDSVFHIKMNVLQNFHICIGVPLKYFFYFIKHAEHLIKKKILFACSNARGVPVKSFIAYIITSIVF